MIFISVTTRSVFPLKREGASNDWCVECLRGLVNWINYLDTYLEAGNVGQ